MPLRETEGPFLRHQTKAKVNKHEEKLANLADYCSAKEEDANNIWSSPCQSREPYINA